MTEYDATITDITHRDGEGRYYVTHIRDRKVVLTDHSTGEMVYVPKSAIPASVGAIHEGQRVDWGTVVDSRHDSVRLQYPTPDGKWW